MVAIETYLTLATEAASEERDQNFRAAYGLWADAVPLAKNSQNKEWAEARQALCEVRRAHPLSQRHKGSTES